MIILGIDPGYAIVGFGVVDYKASRFKVFDYGAITTPSDMPFENRLLSIYDDLVEIITKWKPHAVAVEKIFFTTNQKTAIAVAEARGVIMLAAMQNGAKFYEYTPLQVKQSVVGYGKAVKNQVIEMTTRILNLEKSPKPDDVADALAIAVCHAHSAGSLINQELMKKIK